MSNLPHVPMNKRRVKFTYDPHFKSFLGDVEDLQPLSLLEMVEYMCDNGYIGSVTSQVHQWVDHMNYTTKFKISNVRQMTLKERWER